MKEENQKAIPVTPYNQEGSKKEQVSTMFNNIAPYYDLLNRLLSLGIDKRWRKKAIACLKPLAPQRLLDVATGTADLALEAKRQLNCPEIIGVDISDEMLEIGRKKIAKLQLDKQIELQSGDSEKLLFQDNSFDACTVAFGVRNFENLDKGLKEINRVLRSGGEVVVLEFSRPRIFPFKQLFNGYFKYILPFIGRLTSKDPRAYSYLYESVQAFPDGPDFITRLEQAGFKKATYKPLTIGICTIYHAEK
ncbi:MAG: bifunctional demethylmenaquinone methyltransferase/2-methoxy-6-polyprenyl-1,4-benzoquinol methylase UbiE [Saprospiraceae bacterium]|nr:bifunctional demethylmenaquinone methyltransferase/2-methoxy-6-polyprenyl-1,4-benzoquinol methylase UbiE [Saprospiraceae bacterium]